MPSLSRLSVSSGHPQLCTPTIMANLNSLPVPCSFLIVLTAWKWPTVTALGWSPTISASQPPWDADALVGPGNIWVTYCLKPNLLDPQKLLPAFGGGSKKW